MKGTSLLLLVLTLTLAMGFPGVHCSGTERTEVPTTRFFSDGDLISGWYWLRDPSFNQFAEWAFEGIPPETEDLVLDLEVLATSRADGSRGIDAHFFLSYGIPPRGGQGGLIVGTKEVVLPNVSPPHDPVGYTCRGRVTIPRKNLERASVLWIRVHRNPGPFLSGESPSTVHVAFRKESVTLLLGEEAEEARGGFVEADADRREDAAVIAPGVVSGNLGQRRSDGSMDSIDWYRFPVEKGQIINLSLTFPQGASFALSLYPPDSTSSVGNVVTEGNTRSLEYVAGENGEWFVRVSRLQGAGEYELTIGKEAMVTPTPTSTHTPQPTPTPTPQPPPEVTPPPDLATPPPFAGYLITVVTGDKTGTGTDAKVFITLYGEKGNSTELFLDNPSATTSSGTRRMSSPFTPLRLEIWELFAEFISATTIVVPPRDGTWRTSP